MAFYMILYKIQKNSIYILPKFAKILPNSLPKMYSKFGKFVYLYLFITIVGEREGLVLFVNFVFWKSSTPNCVWLMRLYRNLLWHYV